MPCHIAAASVLLCASAVAKADCFDDSALRYRVNVDLLRAIAKGESNFNPNAIHWNSDGSHDVGIMQINSTHFDYLARFHITEHRLYDKCLNIAAGAWILAGAIQHYGPTWRAVGAYGAGYRVDKEKARVGYATKVIRLLSNIASQTRNADVDSDMAHSNSNLTVVER